MGPKFATRGEAVSPLAVFLVLLLVLLAALFLICTVWRVFL
jgi:hypothetical protein